MLEKTILTFHPAQIS